MRREPLSTSPALFLLPLILASSAGATPGATECGTEMMGRIALVTGATGQIGREIALGVARSGYTTILACRDEQRGNALVKDVAQETGGDVRLALVDLSSIKSIKAFATKLTGEHPGIHLLVNNAATVAQSRALSADGLEMQFAVNVQAYYSLMAALAPALKHAGASGAGRGARVVNVASQYAGHLDLDDLQFERRPYDATAAYKQSKQADRMLTRSAAAELFADGGVTVNSCHPGVVTSKLLQDLGMARGFDSAAAGAATPLMLALEPSLEGKTGGSLRPPP